MHKNTLDELAALQRSLLLLFLMDSQLSFVLFAAPQKPCNSSHTILSHPRHFSNSVPSIFYAAHSFSASSLPDVPAGISNGHTNLPSAFFCLTPCLTFIFFKSGLTEEASIPPRQNCPIVMPELPSFLIPLASWPSTSLEHHPMSLCVV